MNDILINGFSVPQLIDHVTSMQERMRKMPASKKEAQRHDLIQMQTVLKRKLEFLASAPGRSNIDAWSKAAGCTVNVRGNNGQGKILGRSTVDPSSSVIVQMEHGPHDYYPAEIEIVISNELMYNGTR
jgi:uncharacterized protein (UPF0333 family)